jgi:hypothetical protein
MKIQRFDEKKLIPKENWTFGKFDDIINLEEEINKLESEYERYIKELNYYLIEYLKIHPELIFFGKSLHPKIGKISRSPVYPTYYLDVECNLGYQSVCSSSFTKENVEDLLEFIKNPELYKTANKYNL